MNETHQRKAFRYAIAFLSDEINSLKISLKMNNYSKSIRNSLEQRLAEFEKDYSDLIQYGLDK